MISFGIFGDFEDAEDIENAEIAVNAEDIEDAKDIEDAEIVSISQILDKYELSHMYRSDIVKVYKVIWKQISYKFGVCISVYTVSRVLV